MHVTNLRRVGGSVMLAVPPAILDLLDLRAGASVSIAVEGSRLIVEGRSRPRYELAELLARCDPAGDMPEEDRGWTLGGPVGQELL